MKKKNFSTSGFSKIEKRDSDLESLLHSEHVVHIEKMAIGGNGVARIQYKEKSLVVFVERVAPHEKAKIKITAIEKSFLKADLIEVLTPSPFRRLAPCIYFASCGGCSWQHFSEDEQLRQKENILNELLRKFLPQSTYHLESSVASDLTFNYRNRIQLKQLNNKLGYFQKNTHDIVDIDACLIADSKISEQIPILKSKLKPTAEIRKYELRLNQEHKFESYRIGDSGEGLAFSQVNNAVNAKLVQAVVEIVSAENPDFLSELYAGSGNFTFSLSTQLKNLKIESAELNSELTTYAVKQIFKLNLQKRLLSFTADCDDFVQRRPLSNEFILLDPPRAGCSEIVVQKVAESGAKNLIYISCHPVNLARDLKRLLAIESKYKIKRLQVFDMFPQTDHFETLVWLSLNES